MLHKNFPFEFKNLDDSGTFEATVAVFNNVDKGGDRIMPGAFAKTLAAWEATGDPIPVIFNHDWGTPDAHIGVVEKAIETSQGLLVKGRLDVADNPVAKQVHRLMQRRSLKEFSFGYSVPAGGEKRAKDGANDLLHIDLAEVGPTLKGMNPATELHSVKSSVLAEAVAAAATAPLGIDATKSVITELQEVKARLATLEKALETQKNEAEVTGTSPVDPLRQQAEKAALELASGGLSQHPQPKQAPAPERDLVPVDELKRQSRDLMLQVLSGMEL